ncbi:MAG: ATP-binding protein [Elusimicrobia bacterium]|nr:ATP-binding protein [Elusimicrobiota bacterium]
MTHTFKRVLSLPSLVGATNHFLFGPRSTGKTYLIRKQLPDVKVYDLLDSDVFSRLARRPKMLGEELSTTDKVVVIDEIQKLPTLLDEVHRLIETKGTRFLLTGSSARKLRRGGSNLLGGRARQARLYPLCFPEIPQFDLITYLNRGGIPRILPLKDYEDELRGYADLYLREEITAEALVRNISQFARFLDIMALQNGEELNYEGIASDCGVPARTLQNYVQILEETLIGFPVHSFRATKKRKAITRSKFFLFDMGVANVMAQRGEIKPHSELFGKCFEHFMFLELRSYLGYRRRPQALQYWRSTTGFEVDCVVGDRLAIEFKSGDMVSERHLRGLKALREEGLVKNFAVVSLDPQKRVVDGITVYPWREFLIALWADKIFPHE